MAKLEENLPADYKPVPVAEARAIAETYNKDQVLIFAYDEQAGQLHITTYGSTTEHGKLAASGGDKVADMLGLKAGRQYENYLEDEEYQKGKKPRKK